MSFIIEVDNSAVLAAFNRLLQLGENLNPVLHAIGEDITARAKHRFETSTAPDGMLWAENSAKSTLKNKKGNKPLIGETGHLASQIEPAVNDGSVTIFANPRYAAIQQFGGKKSEFPHLWGDIPARPFLPVMQNKDLYPDEEREILKVVNEAILSAIG
jgi:phage virion morphogenesis protein